MSQNEPKTGEDSGGWQITERDVKSSRRPSLLSALVVASILFVMDALIGNVVFLCLLMGICQVVVVLPLSFLKRNWPTRRQRLRNIAVYLGALLLAVVMVKVNAYVAPLHAHRVVDAIESYHVANGVYPKELDDLVPQFIDHVPFAQYTFGGSFYYMRGVKTEAPIFFYNPHGMDHHGYDFKPKRWFYLG